MKNENKIRQDRECPMCYSSNSTELGRLKISTLLRSNPGYNSDWFDKHPEILNNSFPFAQCIDCNFVYSRYKLNDALTFEYYNKGINAQFSEAKIYKSSKRNSHLIIWRKLLNLSGLDSPIKVLDYGAGWGDFLAVAKCVGVDVVGLEFDERKIAFANRHGIPCGNFEFIEKNAPYDIFICNQVLEHLERPQEALLNLRKQLKRGAVGFVSVPDFPLEIVNKQLDLIMQNKLPSKDFDPLGHLNYFDVSSFRKILTETGFQEIKWPKPKGFRGKISNLFKRLNGQYQTSEIPSLFVRAV